jgi:hypothetical protein
VCNQRLGNKGLEPFIKAQDNIEAAKNCGREHAMSDQCKSSWNSLEVAKLLVAPVVVALLGYFVQAQLAQQARNTQELLAEQARSWQQNQRLVERRLQLYDAIRVDLNKIYCFVEDIGDWRKENPDTIVTYKRRVDTEMYTQRAVWSPDTFAAYREYISSAFGEYSGGMGQNAPIRTVSAEKRVGIKGWNAGWEARLTNERSPDHKRNYESLQNLMARDLALSTKSGG